MNSTLPSIFTEVPSKPDYNPVRKSMEASADRAEVAAALKLFSSMPSSTAVLANPVRHHHQLAATNTTLQVDIRSFTVRGRVFEEDIVSGRVDAIGVIFAGLFGRSPTDEESRLLQQYLAESLSAGIERSFEKTQEFMNAYPDASPDIAVQYWASIRKAAWKTGPINASRKPAELLAEMIGIHMENVA